MMLLRVYGEQGTGHRGNKNVKAFNINSVQETRSEVRRGELFNTWLFPPGTLITGVCLVWMCLNNPLRHEARPKSPPLQSRCTFFFF